MGADRATTGTPTVGMTDTDATQDPGDAAWRKRAVERSLRTARARAVTRSDRFIAAATELLVETGRTDFTVQEIVERSQMSLRSFYQHFPSKDELLLALFEELIASWAQRLRGEVYRFDDPIEQLHAYLIGMFRSVPDDRAPSRALTIYHMRLAETHPSEFAHAVAPQVDLLHEIVRAGAATGVFRSDIDAAQLTMITTHMVVSTLHLSVLGAEWAGTAVTEDALWAFCAGGLGVADPSVVRRPARGRRRTAHS
jgi:AcrR family transcriptional regulator